MTTICLYLLLLAVLLYVYLYILLFLLLLLFPMASLTHNMRNASLEAASVDFFIFSCFFENIRHRHFFSICYTKCEEEHSVLIPKTDFCDVKKLVIYSVYEGRKEEVQKSK